MNHYGSRIKIIIGLSTVLLLFGSPVAWSSVMLKTVVQQRHSRSVNSVDFSSDGSLLATAGGDSEIKLWRVPDGRLIRTMRLPESTETLNWGINSVDFSPDKRLLASVSKNCITLWWVQDGAIKSTIYDSSITANGTITCVAFSPDGSFLASASVVFDGSRANNNTIKIWQVSDGKLVKTIEKQQYINSIVFSADGKLLASASGSAVFGRGNTIKIWRISDCSLIRTIWGDNRFTSAAFSPDSKILASGDRGQRIKLWGVSDGMLIRTFEGHNSHVNAVSFSPDGRMLASASGDYVTCQREHSIRLWQVSDGMLIRTFEGHNSPVNAVSFSPNGRLLASGSDDGTVKLWHIKEGRLDRTLAENTPCPDSLAFSMDGSCLVSLFKDYRFSIRAVNLWRVSDGKILNVFDRNILGGIKDPVFSNDGKLFAFGGGYKNPIQIWYVLDGKNLQKIHEIYEDDIYDEPIVFSPDGRFLVSQALKRVRLWKISDGTLIKSFQVSSYHNINQFSPDGNYMTTSENGSVKLWRIPSGKFVRTLSEKAEFVLFSPNSNYLIMKFYDKHLKNNKIGVFRVSDGTLIKFLEDRQSYGGHITFSSNSKIFAVADQKNINLWRVPNGIFLKTLKGNKSDYLKSVSFSPDGRFIASGNSYGTIKLWRVSDGVLIKTLKGHHGEVNLISFSPDTRLMASASKDRTIKLWEIEKGELLCTLFNFGKGLSVALTPEGFFAGTGNFNEHVHFVRGLEVYDFNQFYDAFYRPDLVEKKLKGEDISKWRPQD